MDGRKDLAIYFNKHDRLDVYLSTLTSGNWAISTSAISISNIGKSMQLMDVDSDGRVDILTNENVHYLKPTGSGGSTPNSFTHVSAQPVTWTTSTTPSFSSAPSGANFTRYTFDLQPAGDLNGDGAADVIRIHRQMTGIYDPGPYGSTVEECLRLEEHYFAMVNTGDGTEFEEFAYLGSSQKIDDLDYNDCDEEADLSPILNYQTPNINGDNYTDLLIRDGREYFYYLNNGLGFVEQDINGVTLSGGRQIKNADGDYVHGKLVHQFSNEDRAKEAHINIVDFDGDGYSDFLYRVDSRTAQFRYKTWDSAAQDFSSKEIGTHVYVDSSYQAEDERHFFFDANGDGHIDYFRNYNRTYMQLRPNKVTGFNGIVSQIVNGLGAKTDINYSYIAGSSHYYSLTELDTQTNLYTELAQPFNGASSNGQTLASSFNGAVMEFSAPLFVVTSVDGDAPAGNPSFGQAGNVDQNAQSRIDYYYAHARMQAGGVGFLGFRSIATRDPQTRVTVQTDYRQDWPFVGLPHRTIKFAPHDSVKIHVDIDTSVSFYNGGPENPGPSIMSIKENTWALNGWLSTWPGLAESGTTQLPPLKPFIHTSDEKSYGFTSDKGSVDGEDQIAPALAEGYSHETCPTGADQCYNIYYTYQETAHTINTTNAYDAEGNPTSITVVASGQGLTQTQVSTHEYNGGTITLPLIDGISRSATYAQLGRLTNTTVNTTRTDADGNVGEAVEKSTSFEYYTSGHKAGLLKTETLMPDDSTTENKTYELINTYDYDTFGNKVSTISQAADIDYSFSGGMLGGSTYETRQVAKVEYDSTGRYVDKTYQDFGGSIGEILVSEVTERGANGAPERTESRINSAWTEIDYDILGRQVASRTNVGLSDGSSTPSTATQYFRCGTSGVSCPGGAAMLVQASASDGSLSRTYTDKLARTIRTESLALDGSMAIVDTEYDELGRTIRSTAPYAANDTVYWAENQYDVLGRVITKRATDGSDTKFIYKVYETIATNALNQTTRETRNGFGELVQVDDPAGGTLTYTYNHRGDLVTVHKIAASNDAFFTQSFLGVDPEPHKTVVTQLIYDDMGRKIEMIDADKGHWQYKYNAFGELLWQKDAKGQVVLQRYDAQGRMFTRTDYKSNAGVEQHTRWYYDGNTDDPAANIANAKGQVSAIVMTNNAASDALRCTTANGALQCQYPTFDQFGRNIKSDNHIFAEQTSKGVYTTEVLYDAQGRIDEQYDALNKLVKANASDTVGITSGIKNTYTNGYLTEVTDLRSNAPVYTVEEQNIRGQIKSVLFGNGVRTTYTYDDATGMLTNKQAANGYPFLVQDLSYLWDVGGNLTYRQNLGFDGNNLRDIKESFCYDNLNRLRRAYKGTLNGECYGALTTGVSVSTTDYDSFGNIRYRYDGTTANYSATSGQAYFYGASFSENYATYAGPHAVSRITKNGVTENKYAYDTNGNMVNDTTGRNLTYSTFDKPLVITKGDHTTTFAYGIDRGRYWRKDENGTKSSETLYLGGVERVTQDNGDILWKRYIAGLAIFEEVTTAANVIKSGTTTEKTFIHKDHLGSTDVLTGADGAVKVDSTMAFNPWGHRVDADDASDLTAAEMIAALNNSSGMFSVFTLQSKGKTNKGFTGHEMLDEVGLIHMNGRIYDPALQRFMQADPIIQASTNTQSYNRYSYTFNNPLNATDPTGYTSSFFGTLLQGVAGVAAIVTTAVCGSCGWEIYAFISAMGAAVNGGGLGDILLAAVSSGIGAGMADAGVHLFKQAIVNGVVGGITSVLQGGKFGHGFIQAGYSTLGGDGKGGYLGMVRKIMNAGWSAVIAGDKFENGAAGALIGYAIGGSANRVVKWINEGGAASGNETQSSLSSSEEAEVERLLKEIESNGIVEGGKINLFSPKEMFAHQTVNARADDPNTLDIWGHADENMMNAPGANGDYKDSNGKYISLSAEALAELVKRSGIWRKGMNIRLRGCNTANIDRTESPLARQLSSLLNAKVSGTSWFYFPSQIDSHSIGPNIPIIGNIFAFGTWHEFDNGNYVGENDGFDVMRHRAMKSLKEK